MHRSLVVFLLSVLGWVAPSSGAAPSMTQVSLKLSHTQAKAGETVTAALHLKHAPEWHTYWQNPGGVGKATKITWTLPEGITAGEILWPAPEATVLGEVNAYSYDGEIGLLVPLKIAENASGGAKSIKAKASWLECKTDGACVPQTATFDLALTVANESKASADAEQIEAWRKLIPTAATDVVFKAHWDAPAATDIRPFVVVVDKPAGDAKWDFFAFKMEGVEVSAKIERLPAIDGKTAFRKFAEKFDGDWPAKMDGLAVLGEGKKHERAVVTSVSFGEASSALAGATVGAANTGAAGKIADAKQERSLLYYLLFAFVGGLILNVMPCVLPVISLKILGFVRQSKEDPGVVRRLGLMYGVGVLVSFLAMAGMVIGLKQAGKAASWGMQFQNPAFLVFITTLVALVALNLFGAFEFAVSGNALSKAGELASREGNSGAFFNGVLATLLATPCTAPFLGVALGFAFVQPPTLIVLIFLMVGLGLAAPYVLLCWFPAWLKKLPKPGAWMEKFKIAMGFPMVATALWLFSLAAPRLGDDGAIPLALFIALLALAAWVYGEFAQRGSRPGRGRVAAGAIALAAFSCLLLIKEKQDWKVWSPEAVQAARAQGHPVLVDFTANWCFTCKVNKRTSIEIPETLEKLKSIDAVKFRADFSNEDPAIAAELAKYQRAGVPLVLVFPANETAPPIVLPELLTPALVLDALDRAAGKASVAVK